MNRVLPILTVLLAIVAFWYAAAIWMNAPWQNTLNTRADLTNVPFTEFALQTWAQAKPVLPAPHQVFGEIWSATVALELTSKRSLAYHGWITLSSTLLGFVLGTALGVALAVFIVHNEAANRSLMPWIIASQTIPILAIAPMIVVVLNAVGVSGLIPKALISTYLSFFPVAVGMVKGLRSPEIMHLDLMRTYSASRSQVFWKLRMPASVPFLFASMKVAVAASLVGAIVGELPTGAVAGIGAKLLNGSYYSQTIDMFAALVAGSIVAVILVGIVGLAGRITERAMGARPA